MRLRRLHAVAFGPHRNRDLALAPDVVLVHGHNESGKSCFRDAIETILYGFEPARRDTHPLYLWREGGGDLHLEAELALDDATLLRVERVLQAKGTCRTAEAGEDFAGERQGNAELPFLSGLPRKIFRSIYSIELEQLAALEAGVQEHVDDLLLPESQSLRLRPISEVRDQLRDDHQRLWRPDRRGRPRARELAEELNEARKRANEAARGEQEVRHALRERAKLEAELETLREEKRRLERIGGDAPFLRDCFEWNQRKRQLGDPVDLSGLGDFPLVEPTPLKREIDALRRQLGAPLARLEQQEVELADRHRAVLEAAPEIEVALAEGPRHRAEVDQLDASRARADSRRRDAERAFASALTEAPAAGQLEVVESLSTEALRAAQANWARSWEEHLAAPAALPTRPPLWTLAVGVAGLGWAAFAVAAGLDPRLALVGALAALAALVASFFARATGNRAAPGPPRCAEEVDELLRGLPVSAAFRSSPAELLRLIDALDGTQRILVEVSRSREEARHLEAALRERERSWSALCTRLGLASGGSGELLVARLREALASARDAEKRVEGDAIERRHAQLEIDTLKPGLEDKLRHLRALESTLTRAEPDAAGVEDAYRRVQARLKGADYVRERESALRSDPRWSEFRGDPRVSAVEIPDDADWREDVTARRNARIDELGEAIEEANRRLEGLRILLRDDVGSRKARALEATNALEEELAGVKRERDRLALLDAILSRAEQEFRDEHQPDVLRRASAYLARVTRGRYTRLYYNEGDGSGLRVVCADRSEPVPVGAPISRGTLDQVFLCLRLGLLDHLDLAREKLPLVLDDALLRIDDVRRPELYALLADIAQTRQVFLMTCHAAIAEEAERALKASRINF